MDLISPFRKKTERERESKLEGGQGGERKKAKEKLKRKREMKKTTNEQKNCGLRKVAARK